jgi:hypothetical protein
MSTNPRPRGRPAKDPSDRKTVDLRIPVTADQKQLIVEATRDEPDGLAAWARALLLAAARRKLGASGGNPPARRGNART